MINRLFKSDGKLFATLVAAAGYSVDSQRPRVCGPQLSYASTSWQSSASWCSSSAVFAGNATMGGTRIFGVSE